MRLKTVFYQSYECRQCSLGFAILLQTSWKSHDTQTSLWKCRERKTLENVNNYDQFISFLRILLKRWTAPTKKSVCCFRNSVSRLQHDPRLPCMSSGCPETYPSKFCFHIFIIGSRCYLWRKHRWAEKKVSQSAFSTSKSEDDPPSSNSINRPVFIFMYKSMDIHQFFSSPVIIFESVSVISQQLHLKNSERPCSSLREAMVISVDCVICGWLHNLQSNLRWNWNWLQRPTEMHPSSSMRGSHSHFFKYLLLICCYF